MQNTIMPTLTKESETKEKTYASVALALSANNLVAARNLLLVDIQKATAGKHSSDARHYAIDRTQQDAIVLDDKWPKLLTYFGLENLRDRYFLRDTNDEICEDPQTFLTRVATGMSRGDLVHAQKLYDYMARQWFLPATPVLMNIGTDKGLPISCFLNKVPDTLEGIFDIYRENAFLAKYGGGIGTDWSALRGQNAELKSSGLKSSGVIPFLKIMDSETIAISRNSSRRGAAAAYLRIDHPDIEDFLEMRKPTGGDIDRKCLNIHHGIVVTDTFMEAVKAGEKYDLIDPHEKKVTQQLEALDVWRKILTIRAETGEPYLIFIDTVNKAVPAHHKEKGLFVTQSNLCTEIVLPTNKERTAVCCLANLNLENWDVWSHEAEEFIETIVRGLDNNLETFAEMAIGAEHRKAVNSVRAERSIGLGVMGYHGYLMSKAIPFESIPARALNKLMFKTIKAAAHKASEELGVERGFPGDGGTRRNTYVTSVQPTASTSFICGEATPCVEPIAGNAYLQKTLSGSFLVKNKHLVKKLEEKGMNTQEVWKEIIASKGSVQELEGLSIEEKAIYRTGYEMNMREIIDQAAERQPFIDQSQSINLFFSTPVSGKYLHDVHFRAWEKGMKTLYYLRSAAPIQAGRISDVRDVANEECAVCE